MFEFQMGDYVEIRPKSAVEKMLKVLGLPIVGIIVAKDDKEPDIFYIWEESAVDIDNSKTTKVHGDDLVLINGSMNTEKRKDELKRHAYWFKNTYPSQYIPEAAEVSTAILVHSGDELTLEEARHIIDLLKK